MRRAIRSLRDRQATRPPVPATPRGRTPAGGRPRSAPARFPPRAGRRHRSRRGGRAAARPRPPDGTRRAGSRDSAPPRARRPRRRRRSGAPSTRPRGRRDRRGHSAAPAREPRARARAPPRGAPPRSAEDGEDEARREGGSPRQCLRHARRAGHGPIPGALDGRHEAPPPPCERREGERRGPHALDGGPRPLLEPLVRRGGRPAEVRADASAEPTSHKLPGEPAGERARVGRARVRARLEARAVALAGEDDVQRGPHPEESREPAGRLRRGSILVPVKARNVPDAIEGSSRGQRPGEAAEGLRAGGGRVHDHEPRPGDDAERRFGLRVEPEVGEHAFRRAPVSGQHHAHRVGARASHRAADGPSRGGGFPVRPRRGRGSGPRQRQSPAQHVQPRPALSPRPAARVPGHGVGAGFRPAPPTAGRRPGRREAHSVPMSRLPFRLRTPGRPRCGRRRRASPRARRGRPPPRAARGCDSRSRAGRTAR